MNAVDLKNLVSKKNGSRTTATTSAGRLWNDISEPLAYEEIKKTLQLSSKKKVELKLNDNRSTMLSVRWDSDKTKVSLHRMFLDAPSNVMDALACYVSREDETLGPSIRAFIEVNIKKLDYSHQIDKKKLNIEGKVYNLQQIYDELNAQYFDNKLDLAITWFGSKTKRNKSRVTFGLYHDPLKLIKINRLLDSEDFPRYVVSFVMYHEMLHYVCPSYYEEKGQKSIHRIHSKEFKEKECLFAEYDKAQEWIKQHQENIFHTY